MSDSAPEPYSKAASAGLDKALKQLQALRLASGRRRGAAVRLLSAASRPPAAPSAHEPVIREIVRIAEQEVQTARKALAEAEEAAGSERRLQVEVREGREELRALAQLALHHLGDKCPVCGQEYDETAARHRLSEYLLWSLQE